MTIQLNTTNGHNLQLVENFNRVAKHFDDSGILIEILSRWADNGDLESITEHLKDRLHENNVEL